MRHSSNAIGSSDIRCVSFPTLPYLQHYSIPALGIALQNYPQTSNLHGKWMGVGSCPTLSKLIKKVAGSFIVESGSNKNIIINGYPEAVTDIGNIKAQKFLYKHFKTLFT